MPGARSRDDSFICDPPRELVLERGFHFHHGQTIAPFRVVYETYGELNEDRSNAILVCHALSPSAHAAGRYSESDEKPGWWDGMIGHGKALDLDRYFVVCVNFPGSPWGTTGPASIDPATKRPYGSRYPWITIKDMVRAEKLVLDHLKIDTLVTAIGGSLGGMQTYMWASLHPERLRSIVSMAAAASVPVEGVGWHIIGRKMVEADQAFRGGDYYESGEKLRGLEVARMVGHMTYMSLASLEKKFGRRRRHGSRQFEIDSYFEYQGSKFAGAFDANSYIRIQSAMDEMDFEDEHGSIEGALRGFRSPSLLISFKSDWLFPPEYVAKMHAALLEVGSDAELLEIDTINGHDAFLVDHQLIAPPVVEFLARVDRRD